jgi:hypothetical protein
MMKRFFGLLCLTLLVALSLAIAPSVYACTPPPGGLPNYPIADYVNASTLVVEGTVSSFTDVNYVQVATIDVAQYIKGNGPAVITVDGYGPSSVCLSPIYTGDHFIFYIQTDANGVNHAMYLSQFDAVAEASVQNITEAVAASGQEPVVINPDPLVQTAVAGRITDTPTPATGRLTNTPSVEQNLTEAWATSEAANAAGDSTAATEAIATIEAAYTQISLSTPTPLPPPGGFPVPVATTTAAPTAIEAVGLIGVGVVIGLIIGILIGVVVGLIISRWRE